MAKHGMVKLDALVSKGFTGSGKKKFIKAGGTQFPSITKEAGGQKIAAGKRGGAKQPTDCGVSHETGYRDRSSPSYKASPGKIKSL